MGSWVAASEVTGYTHIRSHCGAMGPVCDLLLSDEGVLYTAGRGGRWRCLGLIDPELLLDDLGILDGSADGLVVEDVPPQRVMPLML